MRYITTLLLAITTMAGLAQPGIVEEISMLLTPNTIDVAREKVDGYLAEDPNSVDALVMKGNVIYYTYNYSKPIEIYSNNNESIYDRSMGFMGEPPSVVPAVVIDSITDLWKQAVAIDSTREDIHLGICHLYSISLQTDKVIDYLPTLKANVDPAEFGPYEFANYARNLMDRGAFDEGIRVYLKIAEMYPDDPGVISDIAGEYYGAGNMAEAMEYVDISLQGDSIDELTYGNAFFLYTVNQEYDKALEVGLKKSEIDGKNDYLVYQGLVKLVRGEEDWQTPMQLYLDSGYGGAAQRNLAEEMLKDEPSYDRLNGLQVHDGYKLLVNTWFAEQGYFLPSFNYAEILTYHHRYEAAAEAFAKIETEELNELQLDDVHLYWGWALHASGNSEAAQEHWTALLKSSQFYYQSAAVWFLGDHQLNAGNVEEAKTYFEQVAEDAHRSKYATMCWNALDSIDE